MSYAVDVDILVFATQAGEPGGRARDFLAHCAASRDVWCLAWPTLMGYLRIATHPAILGDPLSPDEAMANIDSLVALPHVRVLSEDPGFWQAYREVASGLPVRANLVPDAHLAALLKLHGVNRLFTNDRDFLKFRFLEVRDPLANRDCWP